MLSYYPSVAAHLLRQQSDVPVIFLTSKEEEIDELFGLKMGAVDFIRKPFSPRLLVERAEAVTLTVTEFLILKALATRPDVVKSRNALMDAAYDDQVYVDDRTIDSHVKRVRKKFKAVDDAFDMIETLYGVGYRFKEA